MLRLLKLFACVVFLVHHPHSAWAQSGFSVVKQADRLLISLENSAVAQYVFNDPKILRPYFSSLCLTSGLQVTRNHPPVEGKDATDHDAMHPGLWLGFGDINGQDYWRNKANMRHVRFLAEPDCQNDKLSFATQCELQTAKGKPQCRMTNRYTLTSRPEGWLLVWEATFHADFETVVLGDQEEMGLGARVATAITEKNGGRIVNSNGLYSAKQTWGQAADWCDYSGKIDGKPVGITLMASRSNFRESWWHNRDYGVFVANPFGRKAMKQGPLSEVTLDQGQSLTLRFGVLVHGQLDSDVATISQAFDRFCTQQ